jgi:hypothetical protein
MEYLKRHYEKIVLSVVLLLLTGAAGYLIFEVNRTRGELQAKERTINEGSPKKLKPIDATRYQKLLERGTTVELADLGKVHHVFNPVTWVRKPNGDIIKVQSGNEIGLRAVVVTKISTLNLVLDMVVTGTPEKPTYSVGLTREHAVLPANRKRITRTATVGNKSTIEPGLAITLKEVKGTYPDVELVIDLVTGEETQTVTLAKGRGFTKPMVYLVDLRYPPDNVSYQGKREGEKVPIAGDDVLIQSLKRNEVTLVIPTSQMRVTIPYRP